jgi:hypothetical protein
MLLGVAFLAALIVLITSFYKKDSKYMALKTGLVLGIGIFLLAPLLEKSEGVIKMFGFIEFSYKGENKNMFTATNTSPKEPAAIYIAASSTEYSPGTLVLFSENQYVKEVGKSDDGRNQLYLINLPAGKKIEGASPSVVRLDPLPSIGDWGRMFGKSP